MTPTEKQKCIAEQSVYGDLKVLDRDNELWTYAGLGLSELMEGDCALYDDDDNVMYDWIDEVKPILRPMSDLTKEITHKGYNDDQPFVPLVELLKAYHTGTDYKPCTILKYEIKHDVIYYTAKRGKITFRSDYTFAKSFVWSIQELDLANRLHFDTRNLIEQDEAVDVSTLDINPYSVKL